MKKKFKILANKELEVLKTHFSTLIFHRDTDLVYENHVPNTGIVLVEGEINLVRRSKILEKITSNAVFGIYQLLHNEQVKVGCKIKGLSEVILMNKSEIKDILDQGEDHEIHDILQKLI